MSAAQSIVESEIHSARSQDGWLQVIPHVDARYGGITAAAPELASAVYRAGINTHAAAFCAPDEVAATKWEQAPELFPFGRLRWLLDGGLKQRFQQKIARSQGVHIHGLWQEHCSLAASASRAAGKPYIISAHGMLERWAVGNKSLKKRIYGALIQNRDLANANCLHALTEAEVDDYRRAGFRNPIAVVPNGIHLTVGVSPLPFRERFPSVGDKRIILFLSRIHFKKGLDLLIRAWSKIQAEQQNSHLVLAGPDSEDTQAGLERMVQDLGCSNRVTFTGMLKGEMKWSALSAAGIYVLPSYSEGFSVAVLEALSMGKPVIVTDRCNVPEVAKAKCGWEIHTEEKELELALREATSMSDGSLTEMGTRGRALVAAKFQWDTVGARMADVYRWLAGGAQPDTIRLTR